MAIPKKTLPLMMSISQLMIAVAVAQMNTRMMKQTTAIIAITTTAQVVPVKMAKMAKTVKTARTVKTAKMAKTEEMDAKAPKVAPDPGDLQESAMKTAFL